MDTERRTKPFALVWSTPVGRKQDLRQVDAVAREFGIDRDEFGDYLEMCKAVGDRGTANDRGDYTYAELRQKAQEFKDSL